MDTIVRPKMFGQQLNFGHWSTDGLVFLWRGIEAGNAVDESLYRNDGTITGAEWVGDGLRFDGADFIDIGNTMFAGFAQVSVVMRLKLDTLANNDALVGGWGNGASTRVLVRLFGAGDLQFFTVTGGQIGGDTGINLSTGVWMQVAVVYDGTTMTAYRDGVAGPTTFAQTGNINVATDDPVYIGNDLGGSGNGIDGQISDYSIYNRALPTWQIEELTINPDLPMQQDPIWLRYSQAVGGIVPIIQAHTRRRRAG